MGLVFHKRVRAVLCRVTWTVHATIFYTIIFLDTCSGWSLYRVNDIRNILIKAFKTILTRTTIPLPLNSSKITFWWLVNISSIDGVTYVLWILTNEEDMIGSFINLANVALICYQRPVVLLKATYLHCESAY